VRHSPYTLHDDPNTANATASNQVLCVARRVHLQQMICNFAWPNQPVTQDPKLFYIAGPEA
jgi:hypothetical protein